MIWFPIQIWDFDSSDFSGSNDLSSKCKSKIFNAAYPTQMPSPQKLIPLAGLKHSTHGPCTAATQKMKTACLGRHHLQLSPFQLCNMGCCIHASSPVQTSIVFFPSPFYRSLHTCKSLGMSLPPWEGSNGTSDLPACQGCEKWRRTPLRADMHF